MSLQGFTFPASARLTDVTGKLSLSAAEISDVLQSWQQRLSQVEAKRVVLLAESSIEWALLDLACLQADIVFVPLPAYLSAQQFGHVLASVQPDLLICQPGLLPGSKAAVSDPDMTLCQAAPGLVLAPFRGFELYQLFPDHTPALPAGTQKITFTSGSTGQPKGVCLSGAAQLTVAHSLVERIALQAPRHLCLLPLATLLENIAGIYAPLLAGGEVLIGTETVRGFRGSRLAQPAQLLQLISQSAPQTLILVPELLQLLVLACQQGWQPPASLQFIAVGGAKVAADLLRQAAACGLPVFQGYGLSECCSVVALSTKPATACSALELSQVGLPLGHLQVKIVAGEIWVKTPFLGYLGDDMTTGDDAQSANWLPTGDLGELTATGTLMVLGRKKNLLISSLGRNIHPEWVEAELAKNPRVQQAVVFGDARPYCVALLYADPTLDDAALASWVSHVNEQLPDYARVEAFHRLTTPLSEQQQTLTANQRPKRAVIAQLWQTQLDALYPVESPTAAWQGSSSAMVL